MDGSFSMAVPTTDPEWIARMFDWLGSEPADDCLDDLALLHKHLSSLATPTVTLEQLHRCADPVALRVLDISDRFKPHLLNATLPLPRQIHSASVDLIHTLLTVSGFFGRLLKAGAASASGARRPEHAARGLRLLGEAYLLACMGGTETPGELWHAAHALFGVACSDVRGVVAEPENASPEAALQYKRMLAVAALQPESLTGRELVWIHDYLEVTSGAVELSRRPLQPESAVFWLDPDHEGAPVALIRRVPPVSDCLLYYRAVTLARRVAEQIDWLERRIADAEVVGLERDGELLEPDASGLPVGLTPLEALSLLRRMHERWSTPPSREHPRRRQLYTVQVCQGLRAIWRLHRTGKASDAVSEWMVYNESPGGYAIISVSGVEGVLSAGMALALRRDGKSPWSICIVRWIRSDHPDEVELGLQVIAESCIAISIAFRGGELRSTSPALILPPAGPMRRNPAILAAAGTYNSRRFILVREGAPLYVAQGRVLSLDMQTANVELFQYEIDPYPI
jgi:cyclic-di-GMP-binding protein